MSMGLECANKIGWELTGKEQTGTWPPIFQFLSFSCRLAPLLLVFVHCICIWRLYVRPLRHIVTTKTRFSLTNTRDESCGRRWISNRSLSILVEMCPVCLLAFLRQRYQKAFLHQRGDTSYVICEKERGTFVPWLLIVFCIRFPIAKRNGEHDHLVICTNAPFALLGLDALPVEWLGH